MFLLLLVAACADPSDTGGKPPVDTGKPHDTDTGTVDTTETGDIHETGETAETGETGETGELDVDGDGFPASVDCNDLDPAINPAAREVCDDDDVDENCNGAADDADELTDENTKRFWTEDQDGDGWGTGAPVDACDGPDGYVDQYGDCDDTDPAVNGGAIEVCDGERVDEDCDGLINDEDPSMLATGLSTFYVDADGDGFGDDTKTELACEAGFGYSDVGGDCMDTGSAVYPGAAESCNAYGIDFDCDGLLNDADPDTEDAGKTTFYADADADSFGDAATTTLLCEIPGGYVRNDDDCDDTDGSVSPAGVEVCDDGIDQDCDGAPAKACGIGGDWEIGYTDTPVWSFTVLGDFDLAFGGDVDGDGADDMYVSSISTSEIAPGGGTIVRHPGLPTTDGDWEDSAARIDGEVMADYLGQAIAAGEDLDGDGVADLVSGSGTTSSTLAVWGGNVRVFTDPEATVGSDAWWHLEGDYAYDSYGVDVAVGDATGDGAADLAVAGYNAVLLYAGPLTGGSVTDSTATATLTVGYVQTILIDDFDGDGVASVLMAAPLSDYAKSNGGAVIQVDGDRTGTIDAEGGDADAIFYGASSSDGFGTSIDVGDLDGDGYLDYLVGRADDEVDIFFGPWATGSSMSAGSVITPRSSSSVGTSVCVAGDLDGDGQVDVALGDGGDSTVYVFAGPVRDYTYTTDDDYTAKISDWSDGGFGGTHLYAPGDVDGDGFDDLVVGGSLRLSLLYGGGI